MREINQLPCILPHTMEAVEARDIIPYRSPSGRGFPSAILPNGEPNCTVSINPRLGEVHITVHDRERTRRPKSNGIGSQMIQLNPKGIGKATDAQHPKLMKYMRYMVGQGSPDDIIDIMPISVPVASVIQGGTKLGDGPGVDTVLHRLYSNQHVTGDQSRNGTHYLLLVPHYMNSSDNQGGQFGADGRISNDCLYTNYYHSRLDHNVKTWFHIYEMNRGGVIV